MQEKTSFPLAWPDNWPRTPNRVYSRFFDGSTGRSVTMGRVRQALKDELSRLGVADYDFILSTNVRVKANGDPYADGIQPSDVGVAVYFKFKKKETVIACDKWNRVEDNIWSIVKTIDALRGISRWGSSRMMEQAFRGYAQLQYTSARHWSTVLGLPTNANKEQITEAYKRLRKIHHPDVGGKHETFVEIQGAYDESGAK